MSNWDSGAVGVCRGLVIEASCLTLSGVTIKMSTAFGSGPSSLHTVVLTAEKKKKRHIQTSGVWSCIRERDQRFCGGRRAEVRRGGIICGVEKKHTVGSTASHRGLCVCVCVCVCVCLCVNNEKATGVCAIIPSLKTGPVQIGVTYTHTHAKTNTHTYTHTHTRPLMCIIFNDQTRCGWELSFTKVLVLGLSV